MLSFPNVSRAYDDITDRISFWGHDGAMEVPFFLQASTLFRLFPKTGYSETAILAAFDAGRERILELASRAYGRERRRFYVLGPDSL
jgi:hypothetical protein